MKSREFAAEPETSDDMALFRVLIESVEPENSFFQTFWARTDHPGQAIDRILSGCKRLGISNAIACELDVADYYPPETAIYDDKLNVSYAPGRNYFPTERSFIAPYGIIKSAEDGEYEYSQIREGFSLSKTEDGIYEVEAAIERDKLFDTFLELTNRLPSIRVFWIKFAGDWENRGREEFWTNENLDTVESISSFLTTHANDTVANGHVAVTVYSDVGQTNLIIDTHKTIKVLTRSARIQRTMAARLRKLGFRELSEFFSLEYRFYHWHYRPARSKSRTGLIALLKREGFTLWKEIEVKLDDD